MATIFTTGTNTITPTIVLKFESSRETQSNVHPIIGRSNPDVTLRPGALRTGSFELGFAGPTSESDSLNAENLLSGASVFTVLSDERTTAQLSFVVTGSVQRVLEDESRDAWIVTFSWQEVGA